MWRDRRRIYQVRLITGIKKEYVIQVITEDYGVALSIAEKTALKYPRVDVEIVEERHIQTIRVEHGG